MLYQETYHAGGDPHKLNVSGVIYMHDFTPPPPPRPRPRCGGPFPLPVIL